jgi:hypothetical protein
MRHWVTPEIVDFAARNGVGLNFNHYPSVGPGQAIAIHGVGVRATLLFPSTEEPSSKRCRMSAAVSSRKLGR